MGYKRISVNSADIGKYLDDPETGKQRSVYDLYKAGEIDTKLLPDADVVLAGIPCEAFSKAGVSKRNSLGQANGEAHPTGHLGYYVLRTIEAIRPAVVVIEEVPGFADSPIATIVRSVLSNMGYSFSEKIVDGREYGGLTKRSRYCMVAVMRGVFDFGCPLPSPSLFRKRVADVLEEPLEKREWLDEVNSASIATMLRRQREHEAKGNGFKIGAVEPEAEICPTVSKGYARRRLTDPILCDGEKKYSFFTPRELARINGLPDDFSLPPVKTIACEIVGQGVCYDVFYNIAKAIKSLFFGNGRATTANAA